MIFSVGMQQKWLPEIIDSLYVDAQDHFGLEYWYDNVKKYAQQIETAAKGTKKE